MPTKEGVRGDLGTYRAKRSATDTPEPFGASSPESCRFVIQHHLATNEHYDLRLEIDGVLHLWAVPKGLSPNPKDKRAAFETEDHPIDYFEFEGVIPPGNYGAGAMVIWDRGSWTPLEDLTAGFAKGKLLFELNGYKVRGRWTLIRTKRNPKEWLLIKERDGFVVTSAEHSWPAESVLSGVTAAQLRDGHDATAAVIELARELGAVEREVRADPSVVMLAETADEPFSRKGWLFELKYDGYRMLCAKEGGAARLMYRGGMTATALYPEIVTAVGRLPWRELILDGEIVVTDETGRPVFQRLQKRSLLTRREDIARAAVELPASFHVFDILAVEGFDTRALPLTRRRELLKKIVPPAGPIRLVEAIEERGADLFEAVRQLGLEGVMGKKADSVYRAGRHDSWMKVRVDLTADFVVIGMSPPKSAKNGMGALHLGIYVDGKFSYAGKVGTGFTLKQHTEIEQRLKKMAVPDPPCAVPIAKPRLHTWVPPRLVCEVRYKEFTDELNLRQPVFLRWREDKKPEECVLNPHRYDSEQSTAPPRDVATPSREFQFSNLGKIFWPEDGYTKGDLIEYYRAVTPFAMRYFADRPVVLTRYPDGIHGKSFFQKDAPAFVPDWVRREKMWSDERGSEIDHFVCEDIDTLLYVINMGTIPLHVWSSRAATLQQPDWCILDLDPKGAPFEHVVKVALELRKLCDEIELPTFVKTSGSTGLHILVPLGLQFTYKQSVTLAELLARVVATELKEIATIERVVAARGGRVYIDFLQNGHGKLLVAPFSARPLPGAPVSTPLRWKDVNSKLTIGQFTIKNVPERMEKLGDPMAEILEVKPDLLGALERLAKKF